MENRALSLPIQVPGCERSRRRAAGVNKLMAQRSKRFPEDMDFIVALDYPRARSPKA